jgi:hypothetical protein
MAQTVDPNPSAGDEPAPEPVAEPAPEPAPVPVSAPATARSSGRASTEAPRRTRVMVRSFRPWSVLKISLVFSFCLMLIVYFALMIIWQVMDATGAVASLERILGQLLATGQGTTSQPYLIQFGVLFRWAFLAGCVFVVVSSLVTTFVAIVYNLISDVIGGVELTLAESKRRHEV